MSRKPLMFVGEGPEPGVESMENSGKTALVSGATLVETGNTEGATPTACVNVNVVYKTLSYVMIKKTSQKTQR